MGVGGLLTTQGYNSYIQHRKTLDNEGKLPVSAQSGYRN